MAAARSKSVLIRAALGTLCLSAMLLTAHVSAATQDDLSAAQETVLEFVVNDQVSPETLVALRDVGGGLWLTAADLARLRLKLPATGARSYQGTTYYPLRGIAGSSVTIDEQLQRASVHAPAAAFESNRLSAEASAWPRLTGASPGAFFNYQLSAQRIQGTDVDGAWSELGVFGPAGLITNTAVLRYTDGSTQAVRMDTTYHYDFAASLQTLTLGDATSDPGSWGNAVHFGGLHWGSNFTIRPDLVTTPLLSLSGAAVVPSTVDVLVNGQRVSSQQVSPGPFVVQDVPALSGNGDISVVVRDALGREQVLTQPFYSGPSLLAPGLSEYSIDLGALRDQYTLESDQYGPFLASGTYRRGLTDYLTLEGHAEYLAGDSYATGVDAAVRTGDAGILSFTAAEGGNDDGSGVLGGVSFEHRARDITLTVSTLFASSGFRQVGDDQLSNLRFKQRTLAQAGLNLRRFGTLSLAYVRQTYFGQGSVQTASLTHNLALGAFGALSLTVLRGFGSGASTSAYLLFTHALGERTTVSTAAQAGSGPGAPRNELLAGVTQNTPVGPGYGYRVNAGTAGDYDVDGRAQFTGTDLEVEAAQTDGASGQRALLEGAATWIDGELRAARSVEGSFAVVDLQGIPNVPIYLDNQFVSRTDAQGQALLPNLRSYEDNQIEIKPEELPLESAIDASAIHVAPAYRSGVVVHFPARKVSDGTFRLVTEDGHPVPAGAQVRFNGATFPVGLDGTAYVTGYDHGLDATATWPAGECRFQVPPPPPGGGPLPDLGPLVCRLIRAGGK